MTVCSSHPGSVLVGTVVGVVVGTASTGLDVCSVLPDPEGTDGVVPGLDALDPTDGTVSGLVDVGVTVCSSHPGLVSVGTVAGVVVGTASTGLDVYPVGTSDPGAVSVGTVVGVGVAAGCEGDVVYPVGSGSLPHPVPVSVGTVVGVGVEGTLGVGVGDVPGVTDPGVTDPGVGEPELGLPGKELDEATTLGELVGVGVADTLGVGVVVGSGVGDVPGVTDPGAGDPELGLPGKEPDAVATLGVLVVNGRETVGEDPPDVVGGKVEALGTLTEPPPPNTISDALAQKAM